MKRYLNQWKFWVLCVLLGSVLGCASRGGDYPGGAAASAEAAVPGTQLQGKAAGRLLVWTASFTLEVVDVDQAKVQLSERMLALGGYVEEASDYGYSNQSLVFRVPKDAFEVAMGSVEQSGTVLRRHVKGEDVTEQYVDVETRLNNNRALRDRLKELLGKARDVKDILQIESELNRVQSEIDSMDARMRILKDQIQMSTLTVELRQQVPAKPATIYGPLGYLYKGAEWFVTKLFIIRE
ncbi:DUF4349 domain-containing protein [Pseudomonas leptonychotis]|uniref:DUF4349 domain-containing protein n=1 Tax=Pseudomonas leptonychotis TaxID=2448482 RepID=A0A4T1ZXL5_9PSED|nr:DUF4349 domain-containing protein [Pseudomonas leptonychotis]TIH07531.1 DUF4349 domain-containing protein [Pseudomonas leptonychotis]